MYRPKTEPITSPANAEQIDSEERKPSVFQDEDLRKKKFEALTKNETGEFVVLSHPPAPCR
jgi:hypothetical protein